jgi:rubredoxin
MMRCVFCGHEFEESDGVTGCGTCPGGCHGIHCPKCGYKNIQEPVFLKRLKNMITKRNKE